MAEHERVNTSVTRQTHRTVDLGLVIPLRSPWPGARWLIGAAILALLIGFFWASGILTQPALAGVERVPVGPPLFFSAVIAYVIPVYGYISERTEAAFNLLGPQLTAPAPQVTAWQRRIRHKPWHWLAITLGIGAASALAHLSLLYGTPGFWSTNIRFLFEWAIVVGTCAVWLVVTFVIAGLLDNARVMKQAAKTCRVDLLDTASLRPFASVAVSSTLAMIGALAVFPIMGVDGGLAAVAYGPGLLAIVGPVLMLAIMPVWPVHERIAAVRAAALAEVNRHIRELPTPDCADQASLARIAPLLSYRRELQGVSEWPFDVGVMTRLLLYLIIPPLTWVGAALIEHLVNVFL